MKCLDQGANCQGEVTGSDAYYEVVGFAQSRKDGGYNQIHLPKKTGRAVCRWCMEDRKRGVSPGQGTLG